MQTSDEAEQMNVHTPTPGPWYADFHENGVVCIVADTSARGDICDLYHLDQSEDRKGDIVTKENAFANARLIAAAPDMLKALETIEESDMGIDDDIWDQVAYALKKARGDTE